MVPKGATYTLCPGVLQLRTDAAPIPDFQLGPDGAATPDSESSEAVHTVEYTVGDPPGVAGDAKGIELAGDAIHYQKPLGIFGTMRCEIVCRPAVTKLTVNRTYHRLGRTTISTVPSVGQLLEDIVSVQLLRNGYALLYCGAVSTGGNVALLFGPTNTGKTTTVLRLVENEAAAYVAEDIAITDGTTLYYCPYVMSPVDTELMADKSTRVSRWLMKNIPLVDTRSTQSIQSVHDVFQQEQITTAGPIEQACFLSRREIPTARDAASLALVVNRGEFTYPTNQILLGAEYLGYDVGIEAAMESERQLLADTMAGTAVHHVSGTRSELYDDIHEVVSSNRHAGVEVA